MHSIISNNKRKQRYNAYLLTKVVDVEEQEQEHCVPYDEEEFCTCGEMLSDCEESYSHMSRGY